MEKENLAAQPHSHEHDHHHDHCQHEHSHPHEHHHDHEHSHKCDHEHHSHCSCGHEHHHHHDHDDGCGHNHGDGCGCGHDHSHEQDPSEARKELITLGAGAVLLAAGLLLKAVLPDIPWLATAVLLAAFATAAAEIIIQAIDNIRHGEIFGESFLMTIAGIGAVCIGEIPEGVMVFLLYRLGEYLQTKAVSSSRKSISALLDVRPDRANLLEDGQSREVEAEEVQTGQTILVRPGEKIPLDGVVLQGSSQLDTAALTGESLPRDIVPGQQVMAGCINLSGALEIQVEKTFGESTASKILEMVEHASEKKASSEKFITRFARVYTPIVCLAAVVVAVLPPLAGWMAWSRSIYSALCFLVISCPCALVISVPLSFFAGIGRASREGVLVKGGNHLETLAEAQIVAFDKTGTLTEGRFSVSEYILAEDISQEKLLEWAALAECRSTHPIAQSIVSAYGKPIDEAKLSDYQETSGRGVSVTANNYHIIAGKYNHLTENGITLPQIPESLISATAVHVAVDGIYQGAVLLRDTPKKDAASAISSLRALGIQQTVMLSGDSKTVAESIGQVIGLDRAIGGLLPQDKLEELGKLRNQLTGKGKLLYAGDGINDTPVLAAADIGIAMGGLGADAAIETADVIIMGDEPSKIASGIRIARRTGRIATENIIFAIAVKVLVMILSVTGHIELWAGVFADVGVCMLCVLNTLRINRK